ncbi:L-histidine N(alpha)-methyltransferase [Marichromatium bheemlicum]|uniref:L-histidine N(Alpha)-methyltransferase n=1 Tax=Marichromatium bheemlicum TaxID=365339 RepID=A0ABX1I7S5_9GAMM|nr:L-histidine N(alpha)-methyltransferase [Marichromatium bheemlicum]NKN33613.1 L-histidine N(alpha)-methyltransferase [Marichromatium bheemlicum]
MMNTEATLATTPPRALGPGRAPGVRFFDAHPTPDDLRAEVLAGLSSTPKRLPPKLFYDAHGSQLFDAITELPEYYLTRTEIAILCDHGEEMADLLGRGRVLLELGSGSSLKIRTLLAALEPEVYVPIDISREHLRASAEALAEHFPTLAIHATCADYSVPFELPTEGDREGLAAFFPGSSIGNFEPEAARALLTRVAALVGIGGRLLVGVDLQKDRTTLERAYDDDQGVTAAFSLNVLTRLNRELGADFDLEQFVHRSFYNEALGRVETHLEALCEQRVRVAGEPFVLAAGERIHVENSYKYDIAGFHQLAAGAGFVPERVWTDPRRLFSVHCLRVESC